MLGTVLRVILISLFVISPFCFSNASDEITIESRFDLVMGGDDDYYPFTYLDSKNKPAGFDVEIIRAIGREMGFSVRFELGTWKNIIKKLEDGKIDVVPMFVSDNRENRFDFIHAHAHRDHVLFGSKDALFVNSIQELNGEKVIVQKDAIAYEFLSELDIDLNIVALNEYPDLLQQLLVGEAKYILTPRVQTQHTLKKLKIKDIGIKSPPIMANDYSFALKEGNDELRALLNKGIAIIHETDEFDRILDKFEDKIYPISFTTKFIVVLIILILLASLIFIIHKFRQHLKQSTVRLASVVREKIRAERKALYLINNDILSGLANRKNLLQYLQKKIEEAQEQNKKTGLLYISIDNIFHIYRNAGFEIGDKLLQSISLTFKNNSDIFASYPTSGCFAIVLPLFNTIEDLVRYTKDLINNIQTRYLIQKINIEIMFCSGLAIYPDNSNQAEHLLRNAELSHEMALKSDSSLLIYSERFEPDPRSLQLLADFKGALLEDQFILYFQPKYSLKTDSICGAETLVRWQHPEYGLLLPGEFIPMLENTGLLKELTSYLVLKVMQCSYIWNDERYKFSINVSANELIDKEFIEMVINLSSSFGKNIILEITETALARYPDDFVKNVAKLKQHGISVSIDDYGTGYSSLKYLRDLSPDELKIDQGFIKNISKSGDDQILVRSTIKMAHEMNIIVVAEGTEDKETILMLKKLGCDIVQGYAVAKPMIENEFEKWLEQPSFYLKSA